MTDLELVDLAVRAELEPESLSESEIQELAMACMDKFEIVEVSPN